VRIAAFLWSYPPFRLLGGELMTSELLEHLAAAGHDVTVALQGGQGEPYRRGGVQVQHRLVDVLASDSDRPDVFVTHPELAEYCADRARGLGARYVAVVHNLQPRTLEALRQHRPDLTVANSESMAEHLRAELGLSCIVVRPPTLPAKVAAPSAPLPRRFVTLVNLNREKGGELFYRLAEQRPDLHFLGVVGGYGEQVLPDPPPANVTIMGQQPHMGLVYALTRVLLMPSTTETWGRVGCEALTHGIPVLASDLPGVREALDDAATYLPPRDVAAWAAALAALDQDVYVEGRRLDALARADELAALTVDDLEEWRAEVCRLVRG
jgi:glycosyltransferase involved in cell wall biosynthesis